MLDYYKNVAACIESTSHHILYQIKEGDKLPGTAEVEYTVNDLSFSYSNVITVIKTF